MAGPAAVIEAPPSRYRVVERGRRLEVIDTTTGQPTRRSPTAPTARSRAPLLPRRTKFDGTAQLVTTTLYDDKAPRTIELDPGSAAIVDRIKLGGAVVLIAYATLAVFRPWALGLVPFLFQKTLWKSVRVRTTRWLDRVEREAN